MAGTKQIKTALISVFHKDCLLYTSLWLGKDGGIDLVEATDQLACHLKHRLLVLAGRHDQEPMLEAVSYTHLSHGWTSAKRD